MAAVRALVKHQLGPGIALDAAQAFVHIRVPPQLECAMPAFLSALKVSFVVGRLLVHPFCI